MRAALLLLSLACSCNDDGASSKGPVDYAPPEAPATPAPVTLDRPGGASAWHLLDHLSEGTYAFSAGTSPVSDGRFVLEGKWKDEGVRKSGWHVYSTPLPFASAMPKPNYAPLGARMVRGERDIPFESTVSGPATEPRIRWWVDHGRVMLLAPENPTSWPTAALLQVDELAALTKKMSFATAGLSAAAFARTTLTRVQATRPALFLPAPATATFTVPIPAQGQLHFGLALLDDPTSGRTTGDGADVQVSLNGVSIWQGRIAGDEHQDIVVDLPNGPARSASVSVATAPGATELGDHVVLTAPTIVQTGWTPRRIVVVGIDTLRWDALGINGAKRPTSPELDAWLAQSVRFDNAYAPAPRTKPSFRTAFTGAWPSSPDPVNIAEVLAGEGFATAGISGNVHLVPRFGFAKGMDFWTYENGAKANDQVDRALAWAEAHQGQDSFLFVHIMDPHTIYEAPDPFKGSFQGEAKRPKGVPARFNRWTIYGLMKKQRLGEAGKEWIRAAYDEEVAFVSQQVARLFTGLEKLPGQTLTVLHADHGEEFWEHEAYEHNHSLYDELVHVPLAIRLPGGHQGTPVVTDNVGLVDIAGTLYDFVGVPAARRPRTDGTSLRAFVDPAAAPGVEALKAELFGRPLLLGHLRYNRDRWGVVYQKYKYILHSSGGNQELYDLEADPGETTNLAKDADDTSLGLMQRALADASGWPTRPGYRIRVPSDATRTTFTFGAPIFDAEVMDPELKAMISANVEWGEKPEQVPQDIGAVMLSADRLSFVFEPGPQPRGGTIMVLCEAAPCPIGRLNMGGKTGSVGGVERSGGAGYAVEPGTVMIPRDRSDDPDRSAEASVDDREREQLETLGYLRPEDDQDHHDEDEP